MGRVVIVGVKVRVRKSVFIGGSALKVKNRLHLCSRMLMF